MGGASVCRWRVWCRRWRWWSCLWVTCAAALLALTAPARSATKPRTLAVDQHFPALSPDKLAHALADFSNHPHVWSWVVEQDRSNYTTWWYSVRYSCGLRCAGRAHVTAHADHAGTPLRHGHAALRHVLTVTRNQCHTPPLLAWPTLCEESELKAVVQGEEGGARLQCWLSARCDTLAALAGACTDLTPHLHLLLARLPR